MILTVTPNPSLDLLFRAERLVWDDANRIPLPRRRPGGQGINVVRAARALEPDAPARAVALLGGAVGRDLEAALAAEGTPLRAVPFGGETRVFVGVRESATGRALLLNPRGASAGEESARGLLDAAAEELTAAEAEGRVAWVACCGSLPPGLPADLYARIGSMARARGHRFVPDCDGEALRLAVESGCDLVVPNVHEAARLLGREIEGVAGAVDAARALVDGGPGLALVTMGAGGAVAATAAGAWAARPVLTSDLARELAAGSAVGAGDALLAAVLLALGGAPGDGAPAPDRIEGALAAGVAAGTSALMGQGDRLVDRSDYERVLGLVEVRRV